MRLAFSMVVAALLPGLASAQQLPNDVASRVDAVFARFARQDSERARRFHHPTPPPPQLKDRRDSVRAEEGFLDKDEWVLHLIFNKLEPVDLAKRSPSFGLFKQWLDSWPRASRVN